MGEVTGVRLGLHLSAMNGVDWEGSCSVGGYGGNEVGSAPQQPTFPILYNWLPRPGSEGDVPVLESNKVVLARAERARYRRGSRGRCYPSWIESGSDRRTECNGRFRLHASSQNLQIRTPKHPLKLTTGKALRPSGLVWIRATSQASVPTAMSIAPTVHQTSASPLQMGPSPIRCRTFLLASFESNDTTHMCTRVSSWLQTHPNHTQLRGSQLPNLGRRNQTRNLPERPWEGSELGRMDSDPGSPPATEYKICNERDLEILRLMYQPSTSLFIHITAQVHVYLVNHIG